MATPTQTPKAPEFEITALEPIGPGIAHRVVKTWITDGAGVVDAFESGEYRGLVLRVDTLEEVDRGDWFTVPWDAARSIIASA